MRMRQISEKVPNLEDLVQKLLLVQGSGAYHLSAPLHCNTAKLPLTLVSGSSFLLGQFTAPQAPAARAASHGGRLRGHVDGRKRARAQYPPGTDPAPDSLQNRHPPAPLLLLSSTNPLRWALCWYFGKRILSRIRLFCVYLVLESGGHFSPTHPLTHGMGKRRE